MKPLRRLLIVLAFSLLSACGGGISSSGTGGSGIGGTGITLVRGNVSSVNGQLYVHIAPLTETNAFAYLYEWIIPFSYAQSSQVSSLRVSGGGQSTSVTSTGDFALPGVTPSPDFVLTFTVNGNQAIRMPIGRVDDGATVTVNDVAINTSASSARPSDIEVEEAEEKTEKEEEEKREDQEVEDEEDKKDAEDAEDSEDSEDSEDTVDEVDEVDEEEKDEK